MGVRQRRTKAGEVRWDAYVKHDYIYRHLGTFHTKEEAEVAEASFGRDAPARITNNTQQLALELIGVDALKALYQAGLTVRTMEPKTRRGAKKLIKDLDKVTLGR